MEQSLLDATCSPRLNTVDCLNLKPWSETRPIEFDKNHFIDKVAKFASPPFPFFNEINKKIVLCTGDISSIKVDCVVNTTNEDFSARNPVAEAIMKRAGPELRQHLIERVRRCPTGDCRLTKGYDLPVRYIIHTVGPKYMFRYHTAAESALYSCYSRVLSIMRENKLRTIAIPPIHTVKRSYPPEEAIHMALRVVRRFIEKYLNEIDRIVFVVDSNEVGQYGMLMAYYFPRNSNEEEAQLYNLPKDIGGDCGQPYLPERQIRIIDTPIHRDFEASIDLQSGLESSVIIGRSAFARMTDDADKRRLNRNSIGKPASFCWL